TGFLTHFICRDGQIIPQRPGYWNACICIFSCKFSNDRLVERKRIGAGFHFEDSSNVSQRSRRRRQSS
ncbi:hypothetical protein, partial [Streptomyces sp. P17]|uniref:hypothetical protein n=1 Tax=Streptomyces sp. P17 TaxID=3074716 RepID=UPI0028F40D99